MQLCWMEPWKLADDMPRHRLIERYEMLSMLGFEFATSNRESMMRRCSSPGSDVLDNTCRSHTIVLPPPPPHRTASASQFFIMKIWFCYMYTLNVRRKWNEHTTQFPFSVIHIIAFPFILLLNICLAFLNFILLCIFLYSPLPAQHNLIIIYFFILFAKSHHYHHFATNLLVSSNAIWNRFQTEW